MWIARNNCNGGMDQCYVITVNPMKVLRDDERKEINFQDGGRPTQGIPNIPYIKDHRPLECEALTGIKLEPGEGPIEFHMVRTDQAVVVGPPGEPIYVMGHLNAGTRYNAPPAADMPKDMNRIEPGEEVPS